jgi:hypothetical protein
MRAARVWVAATLLLAGCSVYQPATPGEVAPGRYVTLSFTPPRQLVLGAGAPRLVRELEGTLFRSAGDTLWVRPEHVLPLGPSGNVGLASAVPIVSGPDMSLRTGELDPLRTVLVALAVLSVLAALIAYSAKDFHLST